MRIDNISISYLSQLSDALLGSNFDVTVISGGEASVVGNKLFELIQGVRSKSRAIRLVTNCSWAGTDESAQRFLKKCLDAGVTQIALSTSAQHQEYISISRLATAWFCARSMPFEIVAIVASDEYDDHYDVKIANMINQFPDKYNSELCQFSHIASTRTQRIGRYASDVITTGRKNIYGRNSYRVRCPAAVTSPAVSADGHLWACAGMDLTGNEFLDFGPITSHNAVDRYHEMQRSTIPMAIRYLGPGFLLKFIAAKDGLEYRKDLISFCEICQDLTRKPEFKAGLVRYEDEIRVLLREKLRELGLPDIDETQANVVIHQAPDQTLPSS